MKAFDYLCPTTVAEAVSALAAKGAAAKVLAGGTDLIVQLREGRRTADLVVDVKRIPEVNALSYSPTAGLHVGAAVPCCLINEYPGLYATYPGLHDATSLVGGTAIQSRASLGGNLCTSSPAGDTIAAMIACGGVCHVTGPGGSRTVPVEDFCTGPGRNALAAGEMLVAITFAAPAAGTGTSYLRFIPRNEMDIAVVGVGASVTLGADGKCTAARVAVGAVAPTPLLVADAAAALVGTAVDDAAVEKAMSAARSAAKPISDMRGTAEYRVHVTGVMVKRAIHVALERARGAK